MKKNLFKLLLAVSLVTSHIIIISNQQLIYTVDAKSKVELNVTKKTLYKGSTYTLKVNGTTQKVKWSSSNQKIVTVSSKGKVKALKNGTAYIYAKVSKKKLKCKITVKTDKKVVKVTYKRYKEYIKNEYKEKSLIKGLNKYNQVIWKYTTPYFAESESNRTKCIVNGKIVYVFEGSALRTLNKSNGKKLWYLKGIPDNDPITTFDNKGNLYAMDPLKNKVYKISSKGKITWKKSLVSTGNKNPFQLKYKKNKLYIYYEIGKNDKYSSHVTILNTSNGKIVSTH